MTDQYASDQITSIKLSKVILPLNHAVSDAKVLTGRQSPLQNVALLFAEINSAQGLDGMGFSYALRYGGEAQFAHAREIAPLILGEDPCNISKIWTKLMWNGASVGRSGIAAQAIAAIDNALWDMKAKGARLPLSRLIGAYRDSVPCYNTSGGYLQAPIEEVIDKAESSLARGIQGVKIKVGQPDMAADLRRVAALRRHFGAGVPIMVDANQQWDRVNALRFGRSVEEFDLTWIEEPLDAYDAEGHAALAAALDTPIATGEMLSSIDEHRALIKHKSVDIIQPDAPRIGGITPFLKLADMADQAGLRMAPHFVMEIHVHLAACYPTEPWVEHFEWLEPLFEERLKISAGRMFVPDRPGLGFTLSERMRQWTDDKITFDLS
ncbi:MAG: L-talarate/galactarate dehydratase [Desulfuromonadales bacterium]